MQRAEGFGQSPPYVIQGGPSPGDKGPGDRDDGLQGHRTSKQHYRGRENRRPPSSQITDAILNTGAEFFLEYREAWKCFDPQLTGPSTWFSLTGQQNLPDSAKNRNSSVDKDHRNLSFVSLLDRSCNSYTHLSVHIQPLCENNKR